MLGSVIWSRGYCVENERSYTESSFTSPLRPIATSPLFATIQEALVLLFQSALRLTTPLCQQDRPPKQTYQQMGLFLDWKQGGSNKRVTAVLLACSLCCIATDVYTAFGSAFQLRMLTAYQLTRPTDVIPTLPWPQTDDRIRQAVLHGQRLGPAASSLEQQNGTTTVVTAYYEITDMPPPEIFQGDKPKRSDRKDWFRHFLETTTDPLVVFCGDAPTADWVRQHRHHDAPTVVAVVPITNFTTQTSFDERFWLQHATAVDPYHFDFKFKQQTRLYKYWHEKVIFMHETAAVSPFGSSQYLWINADYYYHTKTTTPQQQQPQAMIRNHDLAGPRQVLVHSTGQKRKERITGAIWGGSTAAIQVAYHHYWQTFWHLLHNNNNNNKENACIGYDFDVWEHLCRTSFPETCAVQHHTAWSQMGVWLRDPTHQWKDNSSSNSNSTTPPSSQALRTIMDRADDDDKALPRDFPITALTSSG